MLLWDAMEIFAHDKTLVSDMKKHKSEILNEFFSSEWPHIVEKIKQKFSSHAYDHFVSEIQQRALMDDNCLVTRGRMRIFLERSLSKKLCFLEENDNIEINRRTYWEDRWDRDIKGWDDLVHKHQDRPNIASKFEGFKRRAMQYKEDFLEEQEGGPPVEYDFSSTDVPIYS